MLKGDTSRLFKEMLYSSSSFTLGYGLGVCWSIVAVVFGRDITLSRGGCQIHELYISFLGCICTLGRTKDLFFAINE